MAGIRTPWLWLPALLFLAGGPALAATAIAFTPSKTASGTEAGFVDWTVGWTFTVDGAIHPNGIDVTALGYWDFQSDGFVNLSPVVRIYPGLSGGAALISQIVRAPYTRVSGNDGSFAFNTLETPLHLAPATYTIAGYVENRSGTLNPFALNSPGIWAEGIVFGQARADQSTNRTFDYPQYPRPGDGVGFFGPNFIFTASSAPPIDTITGAPEPSMLAPCGAALMLLVSHCRRRRRGR